jgi:exopolysaccharide biosynthesis predicted pyruvyltransferase EpsI
MNNQNNIASQKVFALFQHYRDRPFVFVESGGNFGDFLIYRGAEKLARLAGINFRVINPRELVTQVFTDDTVIYLHGGGGFNDYWKMEPIKEFSYLLSNHKGVVIVGPQAFYIRSAQVLEQFKDIFRTQPKPEKVYFFTRENYSYNILKDIFPLWIELQADHDTAFNLSMDDFKAQPCKKNYVLYAIRQDVEKTPIQNFNPFLLWFDPIGHCKSFDHWFSVHQQARKIVTNRLHSAILGAILLKEVVLLPNNYHKNHSVWEFTLKSRGIIWKENLEDSNFAEFLCRLPLLNKVSNSYKLKQWVKKFYGF